MVPGFTPDSGGGALDPIPRMGITALFLLTLQSGSYRLRIPCPFTSERLASELVLPCFRAGPPRRFHPDCQTPRPQRCCCKRAGSSSWLLAKGKPTNPQKKIASKERSRKKSLPPQVAQKGKKRSPKISAGDPAFPPLGSLWCLF